jgi:TonB-linked SusC/RagA family outer membrane protein
MFLTLFFVGIGIIVAQTQVRGTVVDEAGEPIIGATIQLQGTGQGTITDFNGSFQLSAPANGVLIVSYVGFQTQEIPVTTNPRIVLIGDTELLDEIVVVGYGTMRKRDVTSSISKVTGDDIANLATPSFDNQLAGRASGVQVIQPSGLLGAVPTFRVRGISSLTGGTQPLIIVDGVPMTSGDITMGYVAVNAMADINPEDIASIDILKDGAATAIYGSRAANGVILITTKKGSLGTVKVNYTGYMGSATPVKTYDLLNGEEFTMIANEKLEVWGEPAMAVYDGTNTNWNDYVYRKALQQSHTVNISGGTPKSQYYFSLGYTDQEGIIRANDLKRLSMSGNASSNINKWLNIGMSMNTSKSVINGIVEGTNSLSDASFAGIRMLPNVDVFSDDDFTGYNIDAANRKSLGRGANKMTISNNIPNIIFVLDNNINRSTNYRMIGNAFAEITFLPGLKLKTLGGIDLSLLNNFMTWDPFSGDGLGYGGLIDQIHTTYYNWNWQNILSYVNTFDGLHNIDLTAVQEYTYSQYDWDNSSVNQMSDPFFMDHIISSTYGSQEVYGGKSMYGLASYLFRANYNYDSKYYIGGSIRKDGLSKLPTDSRWGTFWGVSGAYRISRENFWQESALLEAFSDLRLRASYATVGNQDIGSNFPYLNSYNPQKYGSQNALAWLNMGNRGLLWETTETWDVGIDGALFNNRLTFEIAYWNKDSKDLVMQVPTAPSMGIPYNRYYDNIGKVNNRGFEFTLGSTIIDNKDFRWNSDLNFSTLKNEVKELLNDADIVGNYTIVREGESMNSIYGYDYVGVNIENGYPIYEKADGSMVQFDLLGEYYWAVYDPQDPANVDNAGSLSAAKDRKVLGNTIPKWFGGWNNTFLYKGFDLNIFLRFSGGNKIYNATRQEDLLNMEFANNGKEILGRWQSKENPGDGITPIVGYFDGTALNFNASATTRFVESGNYLKLGTLSLGYTLPKDIVNNLSLSNVRFYISGQNLLTISKYKGLDPEQTGINYGDKPQQKVVTFGVNVGF